MRVFWKILAALLLASVLRADEFGQLGRQISMASTWNQERLAKETLRPEALILPTDRTPCDVVWRRTAALLNHLKTTVDLAVEAKELEALKPDGTKENFEKIVALRRRIALKNPLLNFDQIVFVTHNRSKVSHMCDQYFGFNAQPGGSLYILSGAFGSSSKVKDLLADAVVEQGRLKGQKLVGGSCLSPDLSFDGKTILFAYTQCGQGEKWSAEKSYHIFRINTDGSHLVQLTDGTENEFDPCWLPDGRVAFISERVGGFGRCHGRPVPTYTLHAMDADGGNIAAISYHETNEWHPSVNNDGMLVYTRWDYVDRDSDVAHHPWVCYPDGRDPRSYHGNYPDTRELRPWMEMSLRAVPNSRKYIAVAAAHHGQAYGSLVLLDQRLPDDRACSQLKRITPDVAFPESESAPGQARGGKGGRGGRTDQFATPWPLDEDFYLCVFDSDGRNYALCLADSFGNREILWSDPKVPCLEPIPLRVRPTPPVIPRATASSGNAGTVAVMNVYESEVPWPKDTRIKELRVVNLFPKETPNASQPRVGLAAQSLARGVLGTVPVEDDGSVYFEMPAGVPVYFQLLDENGVMIQNMRSDTYVHAGEKLTCIGCHESKGTAPSSATAKAMQRAPSRLKPEAAGSYPLSFPRLVQPVLDAKCIGCHDKEKKAPSLHGDRFVKGGWSEAFATLSRYAWGRSGGNGTARSQRQYSLPGQDGARASKLYAMLVKGHHDVKLTPDEMRRITLWIDCNSNFYGAYTDLDQQARGAVVFPKWGVVSLK